MQTVIDIPKEDYCEIQLGSATLPVVDRLLTSVLNSIPLPETNGKVLMTMFNPSVYYGKDERHLMVLAKDVNFECLNNEWWNAEWKGVSDADSD